jgi:hypothetical protein
VLTCLYEVLLRAEGEEAVSYAHAAYVAASLIKCSSPGGALCPTKSDSRPAPGRRLISIQHAINEGAQRRLRMATIRIVEKEAWAHRGPVGQDALEPSVRYRLSDAIVIIGVENAEPLQGCFDDNILMIRDQRPLPGKRQLMHAWLRKSAGVLGSPCFAR